MLRSELEAESRLIVNLCHMANEGGSLITPAIWVGADKATMRSRALSDARSIRNEMTLTALD